MKKQITTDEYKRLRMLLAVAYDVNAAFETALNLIADDVRQLLGVRTEAGRSHVYDFGMLYLTNPQPIGIVGSDAT